MKNYILKISYGISYLLAKFKAWLLLQELHVMYLIDRSDEARNIYNVAKYKFHHL